MNKAYLLPYHENKITAVLHGIVGTGKMSTFGYYFDAEGVLLNISDKSNRSLMVRFGGWYSPAEVLHKKTDVIKQIFDPMPGKGSVRY